VTEVDEGIDEGYRLTYGGYDFLACRTFAKRDTIYSVGNQIGTGKESGTLKLSLLLLLDAGGADEWLSLASVQIFM